jgi:5'-nucleotidase (lipoprotein e(P4) family)
MKTLRAAGCCLILIAAACATAPAPPAAAPPPIAAPAPPPAMPNALHWVRNSAEYRAAFIQTYVLATRRIEELAPGLPAGGWAVTLDADETVISNSEFQKEHIDQEFTTDEMDAWVARSAATALPGAAAFLARVRELGGKIAIVTNRDPKNCPATEENFRRLNLAFDVMLCKPPDASEKEPRWDAVEAGTAVADLPPLKIVLWLGDNIQDFPNLDQRLRLEPEAAYQYFGTRFFVLPNPMYGSFVKNPQE